MPETPVGKITHMFTKINVAVVKLSDKLQVGDRIRVNGKGIDFEQQVSSMQIEHQNIEKAEAGQEIGLKLEQPAKEGCEIYKITEG